LHLDQAAAVSHLGPHEARCKTAGDVLVSSPFFTTSKRRICKSTIHLPASTQLLIVTEGSGTVNGSETCAGDVWHLEAGFPENEFSGDATLLLTEQ
jgi:mannose-6-phosphate isomerase class I